jgi:uncharacterized protein (TIGR02757 family)
MRLILEVQVSVKNSTRWQDLLDNLDHIKVRLDKEMTFRNQVNEVSYEKPDPILIATHYKDEFIALIAALFAYGNVKAILKLLDSFDYTLLDAGEDMITQSLKNHYYRFQNQEDIIAFFIALRRLKNEDSLENIFKKGYMQSYNVMDGISSIIKALYGVHTYQSKGYQFLIGHPFRGQRETSPFKRWHMYLRWMVRHDFIDLGLWKGINRAHLLMPLDTHTFHVSQKLGLLKRKTYDFKSVVLLTEQLKQFDANDPLKYDFALYRLGQEGLV